MDLRDPKEITVADGEGRDRKFILSKMPAWDGMEIMSRLPASIIAGALPKISDFDIIRELQIKIMKYIAVEINGKPLPLSTQALIDNHCGDWECFARLLAAEVQYNNSFFREGTALNFLKDIARQYLAKISEMLTQYSALSSQQTKQSSGNSETQNITP